MLTLPSSWGAAGSLHVLKQTDIFQNLHFEARPQVLTWLLTLQIGQDSVELAMEWMDAHPEEPPPPPAPEGQEGTPGGQSAPAGPPEEDPTVISNVKAAAGSYWEAGTPSVPSSGEASTSEALAAEVQPRLAKSCCRSKTACGIEDQASASAWTGCRTKPDRSKARVGGSRCSLVMQNLVGLFSTFVVCTTCTCIFAGF